MRAYHRLLPPTMGLLPASSGLLSLSSSSPPPPPPYATAHRRQLRSQHSGRREQHRGGGAVDGGSNGHNTTSTRPATAAYTTTATGTGRARDDDNDDGYDDAHAHGEYGYYQQQQQAARLSVPSQRRYQAALTKLLPDIPHGLPGGSENDSGGGGGAFAIERSSGASEKEWVTSLLPRLQRGARAASFLPGKETLWNSPAHHALSQAVRRQPYTKSLRTIMEHGFFFLFERDLFLSPDAPLPHVMYEDMQRALTFASMQRPPEEQFQLTTGVLVSLLCQAAYHCTLDRHYFTSADAMLFRRMEQQQHVNSEVFSAYVYLCTSAGQVEKALAMAEFMTAQGFTFSKKVFAAMMHPSLSEVHKMAAIAPQAAKGILLQERLGESLGTSFSATAVAVHAMVVHYALTLQHAKKWELVRIALTNLTKRTTTSSTTTSSSSLSSVSTLDLSTRTRQLIIETFAKEKGVRCGPETTKAVLSMALQHTSSPSWSVVDDASSSSSSDDSTSSSSLVELSSSTAVADALYILLRTRRNEATTAFASSLALPLTAFSEDEKEAVMATVTAAPLVARPMVRYLLDLGDDQSSSHQHGERQQRQQSQPHVGRSARKSRDGDGDHLFELREAQRRLRAEKLKGILGTLAQAAKAATAPQSPHKAVATPALTTANTNTNTMSNDSNDGRCGEASVSGGGLAAAPEVAIAAASREDSAVNAVLARLQYLDGLGTTKSEETDKNDISGGALASVEARMDRERQRLAVNLFEFLVGDDDDNDGTGSSIDALMGGGTATGSSGGGEGWLATDLAAGERAWAAKLMSAEAESRLLKEELDSGIAKFF